MTTITYDSDIVAWANEQAQLLRNKQFNLLDLEHLAEEIADVGKSEQRELMSRMAVLLSHLIKWLINLQDKIQAGTHRLKRNANASSGV